MDLKQIYKEMDTAHTLYNSVCEKFERELNNRFSCDKVRIVGVIYQCGDGFVIVWEEDEYEDGTYSSGYNSTFNVDELSKLKCSEEFIEYLKYNSI